MIDEHDVRLQYGFECTNCENRWYYDRYRCPDCGSTHFDDWQLGHGTLIARTTARVTPEDVRDENGLGLAEFGDGVRVIAQLSDIEGPPAIDDTVELAGKVPLRDDGGEPILGPRLVPVDSAGVDGGTHP
jgi:uncharacterized protein